MTKKFTHNCCPVAKHEGKHKWARNRLVSEWDISVNKWSCQKNCMKTYVGSVCIISVSFYEVLHMRSKVNLTFSDLSVWMRSFWKALKNTNVDSVLKENGFKCIWINVDIRDVTILDIISNRSVQLPWFNTCFCVYIISVRAAQYWKNLTAIFCFLRYIFFIKINDWSDFVGE